MFNDAQNEKLILLVDDYPDNLLVLSKMLRDAGYTLAVAQSADEALEIIKDKLPALFILDIMMPDMDGFELCRQLKQNDRTAHTPVIFLTALDDVDNKVKAFRAGGTDYITKPFSREEVLARVNALFDRMQMQKKQQEIERRLMEVQKFKSMENMAGAIAHNFNNLLMVILGNLELIASKSANNADIMNFLNDTREAANRAASISGLMLTYVGQRIGEFKSILVNHLVRDSLDLLRASLKENIELVVQMSDERLMFSGDWAQSQQALINVFQNAVEAIGDNDGQIILRTGSMQCDSACFNHPFDLDEFTEGKYVYFEIVDDGVGMDSETLNRIYDPYFSSKFTGRGLGMAAVSGIIRSHSGTILIDTQPDEGTGVRVLLPALDDSRVERSETSSGDFSRDEFGQVLLIEQDDSLNKAGAKLLTSLGFHVNTAGDKPAALQIFEERKDNILLVIVDWNLLKAESFKLLNELRSLTADVKIVIASHHPEREIREELDRLEVNGFLQKPFVTDEIKNKLSLLL
ncbi:MAG: response regulator [Caldithrix sp.]|nr:response regulator [Caldithrix sp.]